MKAPEEDARMGGHFYSRKPCGHGFSKILFQDTLWFLNIAMENGPFIDGLPFKKGDFPWLC